MIAAGLAPFNPETAAVQTRRLMLAEIRRDVTLGESFAIETTLSGRSYARQIAAWQSVGHSVDSIFLRLRSLKLELARVKARVAHGGHHIPPT